MATVDYKLSNGKTIRGVDPRLNPDEVLEAAREQTGDASLTFAFENKQSGKVEPTDNGALARSDTVELTDNEPLPGVDYEAPTRLERLGAGMDDIGSGVRQSVQELVDPEGAAEFTLRKNEEKAVYDRGRKGTGNRGVDWWRLAGNVAATAPLGAYRAPATLAGRMGAGAGAGSAVGYLSYQPGTADGQTAPGDRLVPTAAGALLGGGAPALFDIGGYLGRQAANKTVDAGRSIAATWSGKPVSEQLDTLWQSARQQATANGVDVPEQIPVEIRRIVEADIREAQRRGVEVTPDAIARKLELEAAGYKPRTGQITRDQKTFATEENQRARSTSEGAQLQAQLEEQSRKMGTDLDTLASRYGEAYDGLPGEKGQMVMDTIESEWKRTGDEVSKAYQLAREQKGDVRADVSKLITDVADLAWEGEKTALGDMAELAMKRLQKLGLLDDSGNVKEGASLTMTQLEDLRKSLSRVGTIKGTTQAETLRAKSIVTNLIDDAAETSPAGDVFAPARATARARFQMFEGKALDDVLSGKADPELFFKKHVVGAKVNDLKKTMAALEASPEGAEVARMMRREMMDAILAEARNADGFVNAAGLKKGIKLVGEDKIKQVLGDDVLKELQKHRRHSEWLFTEPNTPGGSLVNRSRTAAEAERMGVPVDITATGVLLNLGNKAATAGAERRAVNAATRGGVAPTAAASPSGTDLISNAATRANAAYNVWLNNQGKGVQSLLMALETVAPFMVRGSKNTVAPALPAEFLRKE